MIESCIEHRADRDLAALGAADDLVQVHEGHERQAAAADLPGMTQRPQPLGLGLRLEAVDRLPSAVGGPLIGQPGLGRDDFSVDELPHPGPQLADLIGQSVTTHVEPPGYSPTSLSGGAGSRAAGDRPQPPEAG